MRLLELEPHFIRYETRVEEYQVVDGDQATWAERGRPTRTVTGPREYMSQVDEFDQAQGIMFLCPVCFIRNQGPVGTHQVHVTFDKPGMEPSQGMQNSLNQPVRWQVQGAGYQDLTIRPSIQIRTGPDGCQWHGYVTNGEIVSC